MADAAIFLVRLQASWFYFHCGESNIDQDPLYTSMEANKRETDREWGRAEIVSGYKFNALF